MIAGEGEAPGGVDAEGDGQAGSEFGVGGVVPEDAAGVGVDAGDGQDGAAREGQGAVVAGLAAAAGIEAGLVEGDGVVAHGQDRGRGFEGMIIDPVQAPGSREHGS